MTKKTPFVLIDEVDSILLDQDMSPLLLSSKKSKKNVNPFESKIKKSAELVKDLDRHFDYFIDDDKVYLRPKGIEKLRHQLAKTNQSIEEFLPFILPALNAKEIYQKDTDYIVSKDQVIIVDSSTGRLQRGSRWRNGIHEAIEAKENVVLGVSLSTKTSITYREWVCNYVKHWAGLSGTVFVASNEFFLRFRKRVVCIPPHLPSQLIYLPDELCIFKSDAFRRAVMLVQDIHQQGKGRPVLVVTNTIVDSDKLENLLKVTKIPYSRVDGTTSIEDEAKIINRAGEIGAVTFGTNVLGRGTDICLVPEAVALGGLYVLGLGRNVSRRVDLQLSGRAGRNGQPGSVKFIMSLEDPLILEYTSTTDVTILKNYIDPQKFTDTAKRILEEVQLRAETLDYTARLENQIFEQPKEEAMQSFFKLRRKNVASNSLIGVTKNEALDSKYALYLQVEKRVVQKVELESIISGTDPKKAVIKVKQDLWNRFEDELNLSS